MLSLKAHKEFVVAALGGSSGAVTISTLSKMKEKSGSKKLIATIAGFGSGYLLGYWLATVLDVTCDSSSISEILNQPENWKNIEHDFMTLHLYQLGVRESKWFSAKTDQTELTSLDDIQNNLDNETRDQKNEYIRFRYSPIFQCSTDIGTQLLSLITKLDKGGDPDRSDFRLTMSYSVLLNQIKPKSSYQDLERCINTFLNPKLLHSARVILHRTAESNQQIDNDVCATLKESYLQLQKTEHISDFPTDTGEFEKKPLWFYSLQGFQSACENIFHETLGNVPSSLY